MVSASSDRDGRGQNVLDTSQCGPEEPNELRLRPRTKLSPSGPATVVITRERPLIVPVRYPQPVDRQARSVPLPFTPMRTLGDDEKAATEKIGRIRLRLAMVSVYYHTVGRQFEIRGAPSVMLPPEVRPMSLEGALAVLAPSPTRLREALWQTVQSVPLDMSKDTTEAQPLFGLVRRCGRINGNRGLFVRSRRRRLQRRRG
jgi:hypothetical protein